MESTMVTTASAVVPCGHSIRQRVESQRYLLVVFVDVVLLGGEGEGLLRLAAGKVHAGGHARVIAGSCAGPVGCRQGNADVPLRVGAQNHLDRCGASLTDAVGGLFETHGDLCHIAYGDNLVRAFAAAIGVDNAHHRLIRGPFAYSGGQPTKGEFDRLVVVFLLVVGGREVKCLLRFAAVEDYAGGDAVVGRGSAVLVGRGYGDGYRPLGIGAEGDRYGDAFTLDDTVVSLIRS